MAERDGWLYYSDTGAGVVRRSRPDSGDVKVLVSSWHGGPPTMGQHGPGVIDWVDVPGGPGDGDAPPVIDQWIATAGNPYSSRVSRDRRTAGLAGSDSSLFVADHATGRIHEFSWDGFEPMGEIDTGAKGFSGLAYSTDDGGTLYLTYADGNRVGRVQVG